MKLKTNKTWPEIFGTLFGSILAHLVNAAILYWAWQCWVKGEQFLALFLVASVIPSRFQIGIK